MNESHTGKVNGIHLVLRHVFPNVHTYCQRRYNMWPFQDDIKYLRGLLVAHGLSIIGVVGVQAFAIWLAITSVRGPSET